MKLREELPSPILQDKYEYESSEDDTPDSDRKQENKTHVVHNNGAIFGGGKSILPEIKRQDHSRISSRDRVKKNLPKPLRLRPVLPSIAVAKNNTSGGGQLSSPADSKKVTPPTLLDKIRSVLPSIRVTRHVSSKNITASTHLDEIRPVLPSIGTTQMSVSDNDYMPSPPPTPKPTKKRWSFFRRK